MLDKALCDEAVERSRYWNNRKVAIYVWDKPLPSKEYRNSIEIVEGNRFTEIGGDANLTLFGLPDRYGFSHR